VLLEVARPDFSEARRAPAAFAEREKTPERPQAPLADVREREAAVCRPFLRARMLRGIV
jgi:hypothetical protein